MLRAGRAIDAAIVLHGQFQRAAIGPGQQLGLALLPAPPDGTHGMDHVTGLEIPGRRDHGRTGGAAIGILGFGLGHDRRPAAAMDRAVHAAPAGQMAVGRVDDRVGLVQGNVALMEFQGLAGNRLCMGNLLTRWHVLSLRRAWHCGHTPSKLRDVPPMPAVSEPFTLVYLPQRPSSSTPHRWRAA